MNHSPRKRDEFRKKTQIERNRRLKIGEGSDKRTRSKDQRKSDERDERGQKIDTKRLGRRVLRQRAGMK